MRKVEPLLWLCYALVVTALFFWARSAIGAEPADFHFIYCNHREPVENLGRTVQEHGYEAGNQLFTELINRNDGECYGSQYSVDELQFHQVAVGATYRSDGSKLQVVGISDKRTGEADVWTLFITHDGST